ncbi:MAG TPA: DUF4199 domain-containing protein [Chitinophagaceae bacterium]
MKLTPAIKGLITGLLMLATALAIFYAKLPADSQFQYIVYVLYALGIAWTVLSFGRSPAFTGKFSELFGQGFRCFIVVTLIMVTFTGVFSNMHPEFAEEASVAYKEQLIAQKNKSNKTPAQIDEEVATLKKQYTLRLVSASIFGYLVIGAITTAAVAGLVLITRRNQ